MEMLIDFAGGSKVDAHFGTFTVRTDQPPSSTAPTPFEVFLSSIGTCAGIYVLGFCNKRKIPTEGIRIIQTVYPDETTGAVEQIDLEIQVPPDFPVQYYDALIHSAELCKVKKTIEQPPRFTVRTRALDAV